MGKSTKRDVVLTVSVGGTFANAIEQIAFEKAVAGSLGVLVKTFAVLNAGNVLRVGKIQAE